MNAVTAPYPSIFECFGIKNHYDDSKINEFSMGKKQRYSQIEDFKQTTAVMGKIGGRGLDRLESFKKYPAGWNFGKGDALSPSVLQLFYDLLTNESFQPHASPSIFLTDDGYLELCWEDKKEKKVQIEIKRRSICYYFESTEKEGEIRADDLDLLIKLLH